eukprot:scaffold247_cov174-Chaetoceros_neogracile.AAC.8
MDSSNTMLSFLTSHSLTSNVYKLGHSLGQSLAHYYGNTNSIIDTNSTINSNSNSNIISGLSSVASWSLPNFNIILTNYQTWWLDLVNKDPIHVLIETLLISFLAYLIFYQKKKDSRKQMKDRLSEQEIKFLLQDWKLNGRLPLEYDNSGDADADADDHVSDGADADDADMDTDIIHKNDIIIQEMKGAKLTLTIRNHTRNSISNTNPDSNHKTKHLFVKKKQTSSTPAAASNFNHLHEKDSITITALNFATYDYLGMACPDLDNSTDNDNSNSNSNNNDVIKEACIQALSKYGCGSCGPRGFYGTIDAHLDLEQAMAQFCHTEGAILYSDGASCAASTVAAFAKRGDLLVVDEGIYEALGTGVTLSRANIKYFKHNDMQDLKRVLQRIQATDESLGRKQNDQRRFIVVEALYKNYGTVCPLDELVKLKEEFCYRLILDESFSFGAMGKTGRGALEHFGLKPMQHAEIVIVNLENSMGSIGGITIGNEEVVDHQRLSGAGYCFSASSPPFLAAAAQASLKRMEAEPQILDTLKVNVSYFYSTLLAELDGIIPNKLMITSRENISPIVFLQLTKDDDAIISRKQQIVIFDAIAKKCLLNGVFVVSTGRHVMHHLHKVPPPALRLTIMAKQSKADINTAIKVLKHAATDVLRK